MPPVANPLRVHRRQFVIGPKPTSPYPDWKLKHLPGGAFLSYDPDLRVIEAPSSRVLLLGSAVVAPEGRPVKPSDLEDITLDSFPGRTDFWAGRWMLVIGDVLVPDPGGLLGLLYPATGGGWASSSPPLLRDSGRLGTLRELPRAVSPWTRFEGILRLVPGQAFDSANGVVLSLEHARPFEQCPGSAEDLESEAAALIMGAIRGFSQLGPAPLHIGLSGGSDSRRNAAATKAARVRARLFTFRKPWKWTSDGDRRLPPKVAKRLGMPLTIASAGRPDSRLEEAWIAHTGQDTTLDRVVGSNHYYFTRGAWKTLGYPPVTVEGQAYELASNYYSYDYWDIPPAFAAKDLGRLGHPISQKHLDILDGLWSRLQIDVAMDRRDLLFWFYNIVGNYAHTYQESDLWTEALCTANCRRLFSVLLSAPPEARANKRVLDRITLRLAPELQGIPINPPDGAVKRAYNFARNIRHLARNRILLTSIRRRLARNRTRSVR